eukprot:COSAG01_NODE_1_length_100484_cov_170.446142_37_plen_472_part_00
MTFDWVKLLILVALKQEIPDCFDPLAVTSKEALLAGDFRQVQQHPHDVLCIVTGVGAQHIKQTMAWVTKHTQPLLVLNIGSCGSQNPAYFNQLLCPQFWQVKATQETFPTLGVFPFLQQQPINAVKQGLSVDQFNENLAKDANTDCIDMEAAYLAQACQKAKLPFTAIKFVTDHNTHAETQRFKPQFTHLRASFNALFSPLFNIKYTPKNLRVSVIIPTYNRADFLKRTLESVLSQNKAGQAFIEEILIVDDGSNDHSDRVLADYQPTIRVIKHTENQGVSAARNTGIAQAKGNWIMFLDADDAWLSNKVAKQCQYLQQYPYFSILQSEERWVLHGKHKNKPKHYYKQAGYIWGLCLERCMISPSSVMLNKVLLQPPHSSGFDPSLPACEDYDLWLQLSRHFLVGLDPSQALIKYAGHNDQLSTSTPVLDRYRIQALEKQLASEAHPIFCNALKCVLRAKQAIVKKGRLKR